MDETGSAVNAETIGITGITSTGDRTASTGWYAIVDETGSAANAEMVGIA